MLVEMAIEVNEHRVGAIAGSHAVLLERSSTGGLNIQLFNQLFESVIVR